MDEDVGVGDDGAGGVGNGAGDGAADDLGSSGECESDDKQGDDDGSNVLDGS